MKVPKPAGKSRQNQIIFDQWSIGSDYEPHVEYANLDFEKSNMPPRGRRLLRWLGNFLRAKEWNETSTLRYLKQKQEDFRNCLEWISKNELVFDQFEPGDEPDDDAYAEMWEKRPEIMFLQKHGLNHGRLILQPLHQDGSSFEGVQLAQKKARDPVDPICWHMLSLLDVYGELPVRRCSYFKCGKFFHLLTPRRFYCTDSCRALSYAMGIEMALQEEEYARNESEPEYAGSDVMTERQVYRAKKAKYMRGYQALPQVKARIQKARTKPKK